MIVIVAGVAGSGKTTIGTQLAEQLGWRFADADSFHSAANVAKMRNGIPLTDKDRAPWLNAIAAWMDAVDAAGQSGVVTCSALRRAYRDELLARHPAARMVFLEVTRDQLVRRLVNRPGHFFPEELLDSQLKALEPPAPDEHILTIQERDDVPHTVAEIIARLGLDDGVA
ncbi:MAG TPA: gluconokinase [Trebonia sp.]|nr:gluconokinase [Trebonia sp.]